MSFYTSINRCKITDTNFLTAAVLSVTFLVISVVVLKRILKRKKCKLNVLHEYVLQHCMYSYNNFMHMHIAQSTIPVEENVAYTSKLELEKIKREIVLQDNAAYAQVNSLVTN